MVDAEMLRGFKETFKANRLLTYELLDSLSEEDLHRPWPRPGYNTFAKHFLEMAQVHTAFTTSMAAGNMDFSAVQEGDSLPPRASKQEIRDALEESDRLFYDALDKAAVEQSVEWFGTKLPIDQHLCNTIAHEVFHQGMMTMAMYLFKIKIPEGWASDWALPQVES